MGDARHHALVYGGHRVQAQLGFGQPGQVLQGQHVGGTESPRLGVQRANPFAVAPHPGGCIGRLERDDLSVHGQLLAGEYPGHWDETIARDQLTRLLDAGIRSFIDLTETSDPLEPYEDLVQELASERGIEVCYQRLAIRDMDVPTSERMHTILNTIEAELAAGRPVFFHCWGGIGRTGTVAACWLREQGRTCDDAFACIKDLRATTPDGWKASPQTEIQRAFVREWRTRTKR